MTITSNVNFLGMGHVKCLYQILNDDLSLSASVIIQNLHETFSRVPCLENYRRLLLSKWSLGPKFSVLCKFKEVNCMTHSWLFQ